MTITPFATWKPVGNRGGAMSSHLGLVLHVQQGNNSLAGWFNNPASGASSTWWVAKSGALEQYVDADVVAWAQGAGNSTYNSIETEGYDTEPLTAAQEATLAKLYQWGASTYGWANALAETPGQRGFGWHGMGGSAWGGHTGCPGDLRDARRGPILAVAFGGGGPIDGDILPELEELEVLLIQNSKGEFSTFDGTRRLRVSGPNDLAALKNAGVKVADPVSDAYYNSIPQAT